MKEYYADYLAVAPHLFSLNQPVCCDPGMIWRRGVYLRICDGIISILLALRKRPLIRLTTIYSEWLYPSYIPELYM